jgi:uncharacterized membrane protein
LIADGQAHAFKRDFSLAGAQMQIAYKKLVRHVGRLPRNYRLLVTTMFCLLAFGAALSMGEKLGKPCIT